MTKPPRGRAGCAPGAAVPVTVVVGWRTAPRETRQGRARPVPRAVRRLEVLAVMGGA